MILLLAVLLQDLPLHGETKARFAAPEEAAAVLSRRDSFARALSRFDLQSRMKTGREVTLDAFLAFAAGEAEAWTPEEREKVTRVVESLRPRLAPFRIPLPGRVLLVKTSGREEGGAAYCRGAAVVLPRAVIARAPAALERLLIHELFHVSSRHDPDLRRRLYAVIGFRPCTEIALPESLRDRRITNPDGETIDACIDVEVDGAARTVVPVLYASVERYDPERGGSFFRYLTFRLMEIRKVGERWAAADGPVLLDPKDVPSYFEKIGRNTSYIIHPDEILADNFVHLVTGKTDLETPAVVEGMRKRLAR